MSESPKLTRQQIYERIRETSKEEYILAEMIRLGFWDASQEKPDLTAEVIAERAALQQKLASLGERQRLYDDPQKALRELHKTQKRRRWKSASRRVSPATRRAMSARSAGTRRSSPPLPGLARATLSGLMTPPITRRG